MMNFRYLWWACGPYKAYAAELMADFLREHQNERGIARVAERVRVFLMSGLGFWGLS
jgi:tryptophanyl-tRNA synthetase